MSTCPECHGCGGIHANGCPNQPDLPPPHCDGLRWVDAIVDGEPRTAYFQMCPQRRDCAHFISYVMGQLDGENIQTPEHGEDCPHFQNT